MIFVTGLVTFFFAVLWINLVRTPRVLIEAIQGVLALFGLFCMGYSVCLALLHILP